MFTREALNPRTKREPSPRDRKRHQTTDMVYNVGDRVTLRKAPRTNITRREFQCGLRVGAAGVVVVDQPYDFTPLRYVIEWDARIRKGWFATDELMSWKTECIATRELEDELLAENAVLENNLRRETERALRKRKM